MRILLILALAGALGGCATVTRGTTEQIQFDSLPSGAEVRTEIVSPCLGAQCQASSAEPGVVPTDITAATKPGHACITPCVMQVNRTDILRATFSKPGYKSVTLPVDVRVAGAGAAGFAGNVLIGGLIGMGVDALSGATLEHFPNPVIGHLPPEAPPPPPIVQPPAPNRPQVRPPRTSPTS